MLCALDSHISWLEDTDGMPLTRMELHRDLLIRPPFRCRKLPESGDPEDTGRFIRAGVYGLMRLPDGPILERVLDAKPEQTLIEGTLMWSFGDIELSTVDEPDTFYQIAFFDLLVMLAIEDAHGDGRKEDAEELEAMLPTAERDVYDREGWEFLKNGYGERKYRTITLKQYEAVLYRVLTAGIKPLALPKQDTNPVRQRVDPIGKLANRITDSRLFDDGGVDAVVKGEKEKNEVTTWVSLASDELKNVDIHGHVIESIDREIMNAFASHWNAGNRVVTINQIATATGFRKPSKAKTQALEAHVDKLSRIWADVDATQELRGREIFDGDIVDSAVFGGHLLEVRKAEISTVNGRRAIGYQILQPPILMQHAALTGQLVSTPSRLMKVGAGSDTDLNVVLRNRLTTRIQRMRTDRKRSRRIRFVHSADHPERAGLFEIAGVNLGDKGREG